MIQNTAAESNQNLLQVPSSEGCSGSRALSYTQIVAELDEQEQNARKDCFQLSLFPPSERQKGARTECLQISNLDDPFERTQNFPSSYSPSLNRLFPTYFNQRQFEKQAQERVLSDELQDLRNIPDILNDRRKSLDKDDKKMDCLNLELKPQKKLGGIIIKSVVKADEKIDLEDIDEQSEIINQGSDTGEQSSHFVMAELDDDYKNIFKRFQQPKEDASVSKQYQIRVTVTQDKVKRPTQHILDSIALSGGSFGNKGHLQVSMKSQKGEVPKKLDVANSGGLLLAHKVDGREKQTYLASKGSKLKAIDNNMIQSKIITNPQQKANETRKDVEEKPSRIVQDSKKPLVQVANRMKSTYDPKGAASEFKNHSNGGNLSEPDKHQFNNSPQKNPKFIEQLEPSLTSQQKKKNETNIRDDIQVHLITKLNQIEKIVDGLKQGSSCSVSKDLQKLSPNLEKQASKQKKQMKRSKKIETLKNMADGLFNGFSSIESNNQSKSKPHIKQTQKTHKNEELNNKFQFLAERILKIEEQLLKKSPRQCSCALIDTDVQRNDGRRGMKFNYKNYNSRTKLLNRAKSQTKIQPQLQFEENSISDDDMLNLEDSIPPLNFSLLENSSPEELADLGMKILDAFKIDTHKGDSMDMVEHDNCVQYYYPAAEIFIRWQFSGLLYIGEGVTSEYSSKFIKQGEATEIMPNKYIFKGEFYKNKKHGTGIINYAFGDKYKGQWKNDLYEGIGRLYGKNSRYKGGFHEGKKHGAGVQKFKNGDVYEGSYYLNNYHGTGQYQWNNGSVYCGEFRNDEMTGQGVWKSYHGDIYEGQYYKGKRHGHGKYTTRNGDVFQGEFSNGDFVKKGYKGVISPSKQLSFDIFDREGPQLMNKWELNSKFYSPNTKKFIVEKQTRPISPTKEKKFSLKW